QCGFGGRFHKLYPLWDGVRIAVFKLDPKQIGTLVIIGGNWMNQAIKLAVLISAMALFAFSQDQSQPPAGTQNPPPAATQPQPEQTAPPPSAPAQPPYHPQFKGDPAKSVAEAQTLGYMRTVIRAQKQYKTKRDKYA